jgi:hypothetical protein
MTSQINPNNIDGDYPVAGQPNNTQGFRDNFTNTKTNFETAANEITALQTRSVFKSALPGTTLDNNMNDQPLYAVQLRDVSYTYVPVPATAGVITIDYAAALFQQITPTGNVSIAFTNWPAAGTVGSIRIGFNITNPSYTVTLPAAVNTGLLGIQGISPGTPGENNTITFGRTGQFAFEFSTNDGGTNIWIFDQSRPIDVFTDRVLINDEAAATSTTTGALIVSGGVGIAGNLHVGGNIVGNITVTGISLTGNVTGGNVISTGLVTAVGNITGGNLSTAGIVSAAGNVTGGNVNTGQLSLTGNVISVFNVTGNITGGNVRSVAIVSAAGNVTGGNLVTNGALVTSGSTINSNITTTGNITITGAGGVSSNNSGKIGYGTGSGGTVTQLTDKTTGVTLNAASGQITMAGTQLTGDATVSFTLTNSVIANTDVMIINQVGGGNIGLYAFNAVCNSGTANIAVHNMTNTNRSDAIVLRFAVIRGATT